MTNKRFGRNAFITATMLFAFVSNAEASEFLGGNVGAYVGGDHVSNGLDTVMIGLTFKWKYVEFDAAHGIQKTQWRAIHEPEWKIDEWQGGTAGAIRVYPIYMETIRPLLLWSHISDIMRGNPFNDENEPTSDYFGVGVTIDIERFKLDITFGSFGRECDFTQCAPGSKTGEVRIAFRGYFWKL